MSSAENPMPVVALCWSVADEPAFLDALQARYGDYRLCPLRYCGWRAARRCVPPGNLLDLSDLVDGVDMSRHYDRAIAWAGRVVAWCLTRPGAQWLAAMEPTNLRQMLYFVLYWQSVLERIQQRFPGTTILLYGAQSRSAPGFDGAVVSMRILDSVYANYQETRNERTRPGRGVKARLRSAKRGLLSAAGRIVNSRPGLFLKRTSQEGLRFPVADVLVYGIPPGDGMVQRGLIRRLLQSNVPGLRWLVAAETHFVFQADEWDFVEQDDVEKIEAATDRLPVNPRNPLHLFAWRHSLWSRCSTAATRNTFHRCLVETRPEGIGAALVEKVALEIGPVPGDLIVQYHSVASLLDHYHPKLLVTHSTVETAVMAAVWARVNGCKHVRFPHGVEFNYRERVRWLGDVIGVCGNHQVERLKSSDVISGDVRSVGGVHFTEQALAARTRVQPREAGVRNRVCLLMGRIALWRYYGYSWQFVGDILALGDAMTSAGCCLAVRAHRGPQEKDGYAELRARTQERRLSVEFPDPHASLIEDLRRSDAAVITDWGGAGVIALLDECPLIGFLPRPGNPEVDEVVRGLPMCVETAAEVAALVGRLKEDSEFRAGVLRGQQTLLGKLIEEPYGDPHRRSVDLIQEVIGNMRFRST